MRALVVTGEGRAFCAGADLDSMAPAQDAQLAHEAALQQVLIDSPAFAEGVRAFIEKREPRFVPL